MTDDQVWVECEAHGHQLGRHCYRTTSHRHPTTPNHRIDVVECMKCDQELDFLLLELGFYDRLSGTNE